MAPKRRPDASGDDSPAAENPWAAKGGACAGRSGREREGVGVIPTRWRCSPTRRTCSLTPALIDLSLLAIRLAARPAKSGSPACSVGEVNAVAG
jgi:hypothetical protein